MSETPSYPNHLRRRRGRSDIPFRDFRPGDLLFLVFVLAVSLVSASGCGRSRDEKARDASDRLARAQEALNDRQYAGALRLAAEAHAISAESGDDTALVDGGLLAARCRRELGDYAGALAGYQEAVRRSHEISDRSRERKSHIALAELQSLMDRDSLALTLAADAATSARLFGDTYDACQALLLVATASHKLQRYDREVKALGELISLDSLSQNGRDRNRLFQALFRASAGVGSAKPSRPNALINRWLSDCKAAGDLRGPALAYQELGRFYALLGRPDSALGSYSRALEKLAGTDDRNLEADIWSALGNTAYALDQPDNARTYFTNALGRSGSSRGFARTQILTLALVACDLKKLNGATIPDAPAVALMARASAVADSCARRFFWRGAALAWFEQGLIQERRGDLPGALQSYRRMARVIGQTLPDRGRRDDEQDFADVLLASEKTDWIGPLLRLTCAAGDADSAFAASETRNQRDLADFFARVRIQTPSGSVNGLIDAVQWRCSEVRLNEEDISGELGGAGREPQRSAERLDSLTGAYAGHLARLSAGIQELQKASPNFAHLFSREPAGLKSIRAALPPQSVLVEFAPAANALYAIVIRPETSVVRKSGATRQYLLSVIGDYLQLIGELRLTTFGLRMSEPAALQRINGLSSVLYNLLLAPIQPDLQGAQKLYVVLPEEFRWLPVHTLRGSGEGALGQRLNVSYLPTASALLFQPLRQEGWTKKILGVGHPGTTSWDVEYELKDIRSFFDGVGLLFDTAATLRHVADSTEDVLHVAAEFSLDREVPQNTHLVLADELRPVGVRNVALGEMTEIPAPRALVFSNISEMPGGLWRYAPLLFLANGTNTVIASLWQGDRRAKKAFGEGFYTNLFTGATSGEAYARAIAAMARRDEMSHIQRWGMYYQFGK